MTLFKVCQQVGLDCGRDRQVDVAALLDDVLESLLAREIVVRV